MSASRDFFIGWAGRLPTGHRRFVQAVALSSLCLFAALGLILSAAVDDPGDGAADWGQEVTRSGVLTLRPYPLLHQSDGHTLMMAGFGKSGVEIDPAMEGKPVSISGFLVKRGSLDMLQTGGELGPAIGGAESSPSPPPSVPLGRWRLTGEICDGKCYAGVMRPGAGLAHKACANFCVIGGVPPVFVTTAPIAGSRFLLIAGPGDSPMPDGLRALIGRRIALDGAVERVGDLLILHADPESAKVR